MSANNPLAHLIQLLEPAEFDALRQVLTQAELESLKADLARMARSRCAAEVAARTVPMR